MPKSLKSRQVQPQGKHARFQETTIAFQLKENKRLVKESRTPCVLPNPTSPPVSPKRYVHSLVEPVFTLLSCGSAAVSVLVNRMDLAWLWNHEGKWHSALLDSCILFPLGTKWPHSCSLGRAIALCFFLDQVQVLSGSHRPNCARQGIDKTHSMQSGCSQHCIKKVNII